MGDISMKMKNLVEISSLVAESTNFFDIKDKIVEKMLEVVYPRKACVNLFYNNDYDHAYLVCSNSLEYIKETFKSDDVKGVKFDFYEDYPDYIHDAVKDKKIIYVENVFEDEITNMFLTFFIKDGDLYERFEEEHFERAYKEEDIEKNLEKCGLHILGKYDGYTENSVTDSSERILYVVKKRDGGKTYER